MTDFGAEISQQGIDVSGASDDQKVLDTRWITLDIFTEVPLDLIIPATTDATGGSSGKTHLIVPVYTHNLGYYPGFDYEIDSLSVAPSHTADLIDTTNCMYSDKNQIYFNPIILTVETMITITVSLRIRIYALDITKEFQAPVVQSSPNTTNTSSEYGIQFVDPNHPALDMNLADPEDLSFSTRLRPLNILQHGTVQASGNVQIKYNYGNPPLYEMGSYFPGGLSQAQYNNNVDFTGTLVGALTFSGGRGTITSDTITVGGVQSSLGTSWFIYILFKDPLNISS